MKPNAFRLDDHSAQRDVQNVPFGRSFDQIDSGLFRHGSSHSREGSNHRLMGQATTDSAGLGLLILEGQCPATSDLLSQITPLALYVLVPILAAFLIAYLFYLRRRTVPRLLYSLRGQNLVKGLKSKAAGLEMTYNGNPVDTVTTTWVALWNAGGATLDPSDVPTATPIEVVVPEGDQLLSAERVGRSQEATNVTFTSTSPIDRALRVTFDYLDENDGVIFQVIHTNESWRSVTVQGRVKGGGAVRLYQPPVGHRWMFWGAIAWFAFIGLLLIPLHFYPSQLSGMTVTDLILFLGLPAIVIPQWTHIILERRGGVPRSLRQWWH
jgi:hypothetical protein